MSELFLWQAAGLFWAAVCFFRVGAMTKRIEMTRQSWLEIVQAALVVVILFALLTEGRGCRSAGTSSDPDSFCAPSDSC